MRSIIAIAIVTICIVMVAAEDRKTCRVAPSSIPICAQGQVPVVNTTNGCPTCRPGNCLGTVCNFTTLPNCEDNTQPILVNCCPSCKPKPVECTDAQKLACKNSYLTLPTCANGTQPVFNTTACCYNCRPAVPNDDKPDNSGRCNITQFTACVASAPVCTNGEEPQRNRTIACCPTCVRPARLCSKEEVAACRNSTAACAANELPVFTAGNCCPSCILGRPTCTPACSNGTICVRRAPLSNGTAQDPVCRNRTEARIIITIANAARRAIINNFTCEQLVDLVREVVSRFCDKNENADNCTKFQTSIDNLVSVLTGNACKGNGSVDVNIPEPPSSTTPSSIHEFLTMAFATQASGSDSAYLFVGAALSDSEATGGDTLQATSTTSSATNTMASMTVLVLTVMLSVFGLFKN